jgi:hypothetical protein
MSAMADSSLAIYFPFVAGYTIGQALSFLGCLASNDVDFFDEKSNIASMDARTGSFDNLA